MEDEELVSDTVVTPTVVLQIPDDAGHSEGLEQLFTRMALPQMLIETIKEKFEIRDVESLFERPAEELREHLLTLLRSHRLAPDASPLEPAPSGVRYRAVANVVVRKGKAMDSDKAKPDKLKEGDEIMVLEEAELSDGTVRLRFAGGWT
eukprot:COSAG06_NODE_1640_length_8833_cov_21.039386_9_plen_148_part_01